MGLYIKICGLTHQDAVAAAVAAGADAIGFVFAASVREVAPAQAARLIQDVPAHVDIVAVTRHPSRQLVDEIASIVRPRWLQTDCADYVDLALPAGIRPLPVLRTAGAWPVPVPARFLYEGAVSGAGVVADWSQAAHLARAGELVLAGGLSPGNVAAAIRAVRPFGIDVSSGVESAPGRKDAALIHDFISRARAVARTLSGAEA